MFNKILVPVDGSELSQKATYNAVTLAKQVDATLTIAMIMDQKYGGSYEEQERKANRIVVDMVDYAKKQGARVESMILFGSPEFDIKTIARKCEAELVILGVEPKPGKLLGSFVQAAVERLEIPVMLIK